jgi:hypothetical protein
MSMGPTPSGFPHIGAAHARWLVQRRKVIAALDGLDEMPAGLRGVALTGLESTAGAGLPMMLTCRSEEFAATTAAVGVLPQAVVVELEPVDIEDAIPDTSLAACRENGPINTRISHLGDRYRLRSVPNSAAS